MKKSDAFTITITCRYLCHLFATNELMEVKKKKKKKKKLELISLAP